LNRLVRVTVLIAVLTAFVAGLGGWVGVRIGLHQAHARAGLDELVHHELHLTPAQDIKIERLESDFGGQRRPLETEMRAANADLADAIATEHAYGPRAQQAVERFHRAMGTLQEDTIKHVLAMREVMTPDQARRFDVLINTALKPPTA
jgi:Spy/CpxP family protein refolding chaperone